MELSAAQLTANQANAQKSTGPRTPEGKAIARFNARRHGLTGQFSCMSEGDETAYKAFEAGMLSDLKPVGPYETQIAISIIQDEWRINRSKATENNIYGRGHDELADRTTAASPNIHAAATMADTYRDEHKTFANIALYESRISRMIAKNEKRLAERQNERKAAESKAREEAELLIRLAHFNGEAIDFEGSTEVNGFVFSNKQIVAAINRQTQLERARNYAKLGWNRVLRPKAA